MGCLTMRQKKKQIRTCAVYGHPHLHRATRNVHHDLGVTPPQNIIVTRESSSSITFSMGSYPRPSALTHPNRNSFGIRTLMDGVGAPRSATMPAPARHGALPSSRIAGVPLIYVAIGAHGYSWSTWTPSPGDVDCYSTHAPQVGNTRLDLPRKRVGS
jgi:hypothetical protein